MNKDEPGKLNSAVFYPASLLVISLLLFTLIFPQASASFFASLQSSIVENFSWFYVFTVAVILVFTLYLGFSRFSDVKLGPDHATPDYSYVSWLSMLFAAGMGIGLMFYGVAEPLMHFLVPPTADPGTVAAAKEAMKTTFFHWGLHAWAIYAIVALTLAYFSFRHDLPLTLRSALYPLIGDKIYGWRGDLVDIFAVTGTLFGVATSLGLGVLQISAGLNYLFEFPTTTIAQVGLIIGITCIAIISVASGLDRGIKILSEFNMILAVGLLALILILGPTVFLFKALMQNTGAYLSDLVLNTFNLFAYQKTEWIGGWTIFYWGWWLAWAPFVGIFIARISRGRTIREFILGVLIVPTVFTLIWMNIFGNSAIDLVLNQGNEMLGALATDNTPVALFLFLEQFPWSSFLSGIAVLMIVVFFVTSCDSGAMVIDMLCSHGNNNTPLWQRVYWTAGVGVIAAVLLLADGISALQTMTIASALPFAVVLLIAMFGLIKALRVEAFKQDSQQYTPIILQGNSNEENWRERLKSIVDFPSKKRVTQFINETGSSSFLAVKKELKELDIEAEVEQTEAGITISVKQGEDQGFSYAILPKLHAQPDFANDNNTSQNEVYYRAEVHLGEGGQDYCVMGWSKTALINDVVDQYHKHLYFLHLMR
ncbi:BCCT family transporter [Brumicola pallidula]|uniref:High-affinity choline transport protein n=1 Tax=Brumicola pallidula DSM 14239 = ACAM 615 TaxID=1121922 RepID=K6ZW82_9ALTE|nr:choline BCCT transporter BetT [Glaciecola pallidula]GAC27580.1 high-affinity choline transport protein [Glaciecola pallidula DSM 14239 = ACAM 615]